MENYISFASAIVVAFMGYLGGIFKTNKEGKLERERLTNELLIARENSNAGNVSELYDRISMLEGCRRDDGEKIHKLSLDIVSLTTKVDGQALENKRLTLEIEDIRKCYATSLANESILKDKVKQLEKENEDLRRIIDGLLNLLREASSDGISISEFLISDNVIKYLEGIDGV